MFFVDGTLARAHTTKGADRTQAELSRSLDATMRGIAKKYMRDPLKFLWVDHSSKESKSLRDAFGVSWSYWQRDSNVLSPVTVVAFAQSRLKTAQITWTPPATGKPPSPQAT